MAETIIMKAFSIEGDIWLFGDYNNCRLVWFVVKLSKS